MSPTILIPQFSYEIFQIKIGAYYGKIEVYVKTPYCRKGRKTKRTGRKYKVLQKKGKHVRKRVKMVCAG